MVYMSYLKRNYSAEINYPQILVADNNNSLLMLLVRLRFAMSLLHLASVQDPDK